MPAEVYYATLDTPNTESLLDKITRLLRRCRPERHFGPGRLAAVKVHFGELGNTAFLRPVYLRPVLQLLRDLGAQPFLTDTNTLYVGRRTNSVDHLHTAHANGFAYGVLQAPIVIADGLRGEHTVEVETGTPLVPRARLAGDIAHADAMLVVSHFKGHELAGFGGAIKNLAMGCASRGGKLDMHAQSRPRVDPERCTACGLCADHCAADAIVVTETAVIGPACTGCARCVAVCPEQAVRIPWDSASADVQRKMAEYAAAVVRALGGRLVFLNVLAGMSPACDCYPGSGRPLLPDLGFTASEDPVALDRASYDLVCRQAGRDPFRETYPGVDPEVQFAHAAGIGFGDGAYTLVEVD